MLVAPVAVASPNAVALRPPPTSSPPAPKERWGTDMQWPEEWRTSQGEDTKSTQRSGQGMMIDLHCHILPGIDDGAPDLATAINMARAFAADGVTIVACTPHILPGLYHNSGPQIRQATAQLQRVLTEHDIPLHLVTGADNHVVPDFLAELRSGKLLSLADTRYVLVEPPHHVAPPRLEELFFSLIAAQYVPILTHPERLTWISSNYAAIIRLNTAGTWFQITAGSLAGDFGRNARYWAERLLDEGKVHLLATDAHDLKKRPPNLGRGRELAARRVGDAEAENLVEYPSTGSTSQCSAIGATAAGAPQPSSVVDADAIAVDISGSRDGHDTRGGSIIGRLRNFFQ